MEKQSVRITAENTANRNRSDADIIEMGPLPCKRDGRGFDSRWGYWDFSLPQSVWQHCGPGVDSASNKNEYQGYLPGEEGKGGRCVRLTT